MNEDVVERMNLIESRTSEKYILNIRHDEYTESPREWSNIGKMLCWHNRYRLGDENPYEGRADFFVGLIEQYGNQVAGVHDIDQLTDEQLWEVVQKIDDIEIMPIYLYDHSGITISTNSFNDYWDSGQVGWIYTDRAAIAENFDLKERDWKDVAKEVLTSEVAVYDTYLRGDIYGFTIEQEIECLTCHHVEVEIVDSCWGFYGSDWQNNGLYAQAGVNDTYLIEDPQEELAM